MYLEKINFQNQIIESLVREAIAANDIHPPKERPHLESRLLFKKNSSGDVKYTGDVNDQGYAKFTEIARRFARAKELHGLRVQSFVQYSLSDELEKTIINELPEYLTALDPKISVQITVGGRALTPHKDHSRECSMFYLYSEPDVKTTWWEKSSDFEEFADLRYADPDKITPVKTEIIEKDRWYLFNNNEYHSIHALEDKDIHRVTLLLEFNVPMVDLYNLLNND